MIFKPDLRHLEEGMYHFFVKPASRSGSGAAIWDETEKLLIARKVEYRLHYTEKGVSIKEQYEDILKTTPERPIKIVIIGGDGTLNQCVEGITDLENTEVSLIRNGSGNDFSRNKDLPDTIEDALDAILAREHVMKIDVGLSTYTDGVYADNTPAPDGHHRFLVSTGIGYVADICYNANSHVKLKKVLKSFIYTYFGIVNVFTTPRSDFEVNIDGQLKMYPHVYFLSAMNQPYEGGGIGMVPDADDTDGQLGFCLIYGLTRLGALFTVPAMLKQKHVGRKGVAILNSSKVTVASKVPKWVHYDGETPGLYKNFTAEIIGKMNFIY